MIYINQGLFVLKLDTQLDLSAATQVKIKYRKPSGTEGEYEATIQGTSVVKTFDNTELDQPGTWKFQPKVTIDGLDGYGRVVRVQISTI